VKLADHFLLTIITITLSEEETLEECSGHSSSSPRRTTRRSRPVS